MATSPDNKISRGDFLKGAGALFGAGVLGGVKFPEWIRTPETNLPYENGKYQTFPYLFTEKSGKYSPVFQDIDLGTLGQDVDTIFGLDFKGNIPTDAKIIFNPSGIVEVTRVVGIKRTDLETVQFNKALGGDRFDVYQMSKYGGDKALEDMALLHAKNTAHTHTKVVFIGDLGGFQKDYGMKEKQFLSTIIRAQRPGRPDLGIPDSNFVSPRIF